MGRWSRSSLELGLGEHGAVSIEHLHLELHEQAVVTRDQFLTNAQLALPCEAKQSFGWLPKG